MSALKRQEQEKNLENVKMFERKEKLIETVKM